MPLGKLTVASVVLLAITLGSSKLLIWPYITTQAGVLWPATLDFLSKYFLTWRSNAAPWRPARPP